MFTRRSGADRIEKVICLQRGEYSLSLSVIDLYYGRYSMSFTDQVVGTHIIMNINITKKYFSKEKELIINK